MNFHIVKVASEGGLAITLLFVVFTQFTDFLNFQSKFQNSDQNLY